MMIAPATPTANILRPLAVLAFVVLGAASAAGCGAGDGEPCQIPGDCAAGLVCTCKIGGGSDARGICRVTENSMCSVVTSDVGVRDGGSNDAATLDASNDAAIDAAIDASDDAATDDAATDAGATDAGATDAAMSIDSGGPDATNDAG